MLEPRMENLATPNIYSWYYFPISFFGSGDILLWRKSFTQVTGVCVSNKMAVIKQQNKQPVNNM